MKKYILLGIIMSVLSASFIKNNKENNNAECSDIKFKKPQYFQVDGEGIINVEPSIVKIEFSIIIEKEQAAEALKVANEIQIHSFKSLQQVDKSKAAIKITKTNFILQPFTRYDNYKTNQINFKGYQVIAQYKLETSNLKIAGQLVDTAIKSGVTNINSINFGIKDEEKDQYEDQALQLAIQNAKSKAEVTLKGFNMKILSIKSIGVGDSIDSQLLNPKPMGEESMGIASVPALDIHSQEQTIQQFVQLKFVIAPNDS